MKKILLLLLFFSNLLYADVFLKNTNIKDFSIVDFNNDGKYDIIVYLKDGRFALYKNKSDNLDKPIFSKPIYFYTSIIKNKKHKKPGKLLLEEYLEKGSVDNFIKKRFKNQTKKQPRKHSNSKKKYKPKYDLAVLGFSNKSETGFKDKLFWLSTGIPELLNYELEMPKGKDKIMSLKKSKKIKLSDAMLKSKLVVTGYYQVTSDNALKLTAYIYKTGKLLKTISLDSDTTDAGVIQTVSKLGKELNKELKKIINKGGK